MNYLYRLDEGLTRYKILVLSLFPLVFLCKEIVQRRHADGGVAADPTFDPHITLRDL